MQKTLYNKSNTLILHRMKKYIFIIYSLFLFCILYSQESKAQYGFGAYSRSYHLIQGNGDTIWVIDMKPIYCFPPMKFKNKKEEEYYWRTVRDVKKTLPYAKLVHAALIETYEYIQTLPTQKEREAHLKKMEKDLFKQYKPVLKQMSYRQGKLLIKLIDRECNQSSYDLIKAFLGGFRAGFWQTFGAVFGVSLKSEWEPENKDAMLERICILVESGQL